MEALTLDQWRDTFHPLTTPDGNLVRFEPHTPTYQHVQEVHPRKVWTEVATDNGDYIIEGFHIVDRLCYYITETPWESGFEYEIPTGSNTREEPMFWSEVANLTHETQVTRFGFCTCEEQEYFPYDDCPRVMEDAQ